MPRVLVVIEDETLRQGLQLQLRGSGLEVSGVASIEAAARALPGEGGGGVVLRMDGVSELTRQIEVVRAARPRTFVVAVIPGPGGDAEGLAAMRAGADDYWLESPDGGAVLALALRKATARLTAATERPVGIVRPPASPFGAGAVPPPASPLAAGAAPPSSAASSRGAAALVGESPKLKAVMAGVAKVAGYKTTVLVRGESGTGKELVARAVHQMSPRAAGPFVAVNCGAIPAGLLESELFGHDKGAFTGAVRDRAGLMEQASGGTLFLDEIAELSLAMQVNLLRVLQEDRVRRVGGTEDLPIDVRVVAATARDLEVEVAAGRFREDLFYRLNVVAFTLPPLRQRPEDVALLAQLFLARAQQRLGIQLRHVTPAALARLAAYPWPGNVRELENTIERAAVMCDDGEIDLPNLPERVLAFGGPDPPRAASPDQTASSEDGELSIKRTARRLEEALIRRALERTGGNRTRAAELLEISHRALLYKIKEYGIALR